MKAIDLTRENFYLFIILIAGGFMRLYNLDAFTFSADEISALTRTDFDSFGELLREGVKLNDMHPAGTQVFLWLWTKLVGFGEYAVRVPFIICSLLSIWLTHQIGKRWFNTSTGLIAAALLATLEYTVLYGQIARPYSPALMFTLLAIYHWDAIVNTREDARPRHFLFFGLGCLGAMYSHYYAFVFVALISATGLLQIKRTNLRAYLVTGLIIVIGFAPHIPITIHQLEREGLGWLAPPTKYWIVDFLWKSFNASIILIASLAFLMLIRAWMKRKEIHVNRFHLIALTWFTTMFLFGFIYSRVASPILQPSVMIFAFPLVLLLIGNLLSSEEKSYAGLNLSMLVLGITMVSTTAERQYFNKTHFGVIQEISETNLSWEQRYGSITYATNVSAKAYFDFIHEQKGIEVPYVIYTLDSVSDWDALNKALLNSKTEYFSYSWSTRANPHTTYSAIRLFYPRLIEDRKFENSRVSLFGKGKDERTALKVFTFQELLDSYSISSEPLDSMGIRHVSSEEEFALTFQIPLTELYLKPECYIEVSGDQSISTGQAGEIAFTIENNDGIITETDGNLTYYARPTLSFSNNPSSWHKFVHSTKYRVTWKYGTHLKVYYWNKHYGKIDLKNLRISVYAD